MKIIIGLETIDKQWLSDRINEGLNDRKILDAELDGKYVDMIAEIVIKQLCECEKPVKP